MPSVFSVPDESPCVRVVRAVSGECRGRHGRRGSPEQKERQPGQPVEEAEWRSQALRPVVLQNTGQSLYFC